jgi:hypothetical protein
VPGSAVAVSCLLRLLSVGIYFSVSWCIELK